MRKILMAGVIGLAALSAPSVKADLLGDVSSVVKSIASKGPAYACKKANLLGGTVTLRSFEGRLCSDIRVAALTQAVCPGVASDFVDSGCDVKGKAVLGGQAPLDVAKAQIAKAPAPIKTLACKVGGLAPNASVKDVFSAACAG